MDNPFPVDTPEYDYVQRILDDPANAPALVDTPALTPGSPGYGGADPDNPPQPPPTGPPGYSPRIVQPPVYGAPLAPLVPSIPGLGDILARIKSAVGDAAGAVFGGVSAVLEGLAMATRSLLDKALPTIGELALGIARASMSGLDFIADNLTDVVDLGAGIAMGIASPFSDLLEEAGSMLWDALVRLLMLAARMADRVADVFGPGAELVRLI